MSSKQKVPKCPVIKHHQQAYNDDSIETLQCLPFRSLSCKQITTFSTAPFSSSSMANLLEAWEFFTHMNTSPLPVKGYARHLWLLSRGVSLACHTYYDTGHAFFLTSFILILVEVHKSFYWPLTNRFLS